jgi:hypothetical protein
LAVVSTGPFSSWAKSARMSPKFLQRSSRDNSGSFKNHNIKPFHHQVHQERQKQRLDLKIFKHF